MIEDVGDDLAELSPVDVNLTGNAGGLVPVTLETVITETGLQQVRCAAHDAPALEARIQRQGAGSFMKVGIDLGTTNSALAFIDSRQADEADFPPIHVLDVPQLVAPGRVEPRRTLPSFLYLGDQEYVGTYAREQGALVPTKSVHSAKSWLSNPEVDRTAKILPWDAQEAGRVMSPVDVSTRIIQSLGEA